MAEFVIEITLAWCFGLCIRSIDVRTIGFSDFLFILKTY